MKKAQAQKLLDGLFPVLALSGLLFALHSWVSTPGIAEPAPSLKSSHFEPVAAVIR